MPISTPISNPVVSQRDVVIVQRANDNASYGEIHISGSDLIIYVDANGYVNADKSASFYATFPPPSSGLVVGATYQITASSAVSASWAPSTPSDYSVSASWASASLISVSSSWASASLFSTTAGSASWASASLIAVSSSWASSSLSASVVRLTQYQFGFGSYPGNLLTSNGNFTTDGNNVMSVTGRFDIDGYQLWTKQSSIPGGGATYDALWAGTNGHIMANDGTTTWDLTNAVSASWATTASYANYATTVNRAIVLCSAFTPTGSGADVGEMPVPYSGQSGLTPVTWSVKRIVWRASTTGINSSSINIEKSIGVGSFSATTLGSATLVSGAYEVVVTGSLGTVISGDKLRFNVTTLGSAQYWTILTEVLST